MTKLIRYLRPYVWWIIAIFALLFGQAMADLSLPAYMADIVNVGIQQSGIQTAVPQVVRPSEFSRLMLFMSEADQAEVNANYTLMDKTTLPAEVYNSQVKKYPLLATSPLYMLNDVDKSKPTARPDFYAGHAGCVGIEQNGTPRYPEWAADSRWGRPAAVIAQLPPSNWPSFRNCPDRPRAASQRA
jgi:ATP-binding cassette subfamily B protein